MEQILDQIYQLIGTYVPNLLGALLILIIGWLLALFLSAVARGVVNRTSLKKKLSDWLGDESAKEKIDAARWVGKAVFWLLMVFVLIAFFQTLNLTIVTEPLNELLTKLFSFAPQLLGALLLLLIAWLLATIVRIVIRKVLSASNIDEKLSQKAGLEETQKLSISKSLSDVIYWLIFLLFLPAILSALELTGVLDPVQNMLNKILAFMPNIFTALIILLVGWFIAKIVRKIVTNLLSAVGTDKLVDKVGLTKILGQQKLSGLIGLILYILILIPIIIASLNALALEAITQPASNMLNQFLEAIPDIFAASLILILSYVIGKLLAGLVTNLLSNIGFDNLFKWIGFKKEIQSAGLTPSKFAGQIILIAIMLFAFTEAFNTLKFEMLSALVAEFTVFGGHILLGLIILGIGLYFANLAADAVKASSLSNSKIAAIITRTAIIILTAAMALRQMGIANDIITIAFGIILGAIAIAVAISFGIGGKDFASSKLEKWNKSFTKE